LSFNPFYRNGRVRNYGERGKVEDNMDFVGFATNTNYSSSSVLPDDFDSFVQAFPELTKYKLPSHHPEDVLSSLSQLTGSIRKENDDARRLLDLANYTLKGLTPISPFPSWMLSGKPTLEDFLDVVSNLDSRKHPGFPACTLAATKGQIREEYLFDLYQACCYRMMALSVVGPFCTTPYDFYSTFCVDACCVSIKEEPIKQEKIGRIIIASSVVTEIIETLLYEPFDRTFKASVYENYSAIGVGFELEDSNLIHESLAGEDIVCSDVPFFDGSVTLDEGVRNVEVVVHSYTAGKVKLKNSVLNAMFALEHGMFNKLYLIPDGRVYMQVVPGHQSTGRKETANFNTMTRARRAFAVSLFINIDLNERHVTKPMCAGDDCNESNHESLEYGYAKLEFPLRDVQEVKVPEFCSHLWPPGEKPVGQRIVKSLFKLISKKPFERAAFLSFVEEYHNHPDFPAYLNVISELRSEMNSIMLQLEFPSYTPYRRRRRMGPRLPPVQGPRLPPKQGPKRKPKQRKPKGMRMVGGAIPQQICSITDPFCSAAQGAKVPGTTANRTMPFSCQFRTSLAMPASTGGAFAFLPGYSYVQASGTMAGLVATFTTLTANPATAGLTPTSYRINSMGIRLKNICAPLTSAGILRIRGSAEINGNNFGSVDFSTYNYDYHDDIPIQDCKDVCIIMRKQGANSEFFISTGTTNPSANVTAWVAPSMGAVFLMLDGAPASTIIFEVQVFINYELTFGDSDAMSIACSPAKSTINDGLITRGARYVAEKVSPIVKGGVAAVEKSVMNAAMGYVARLAGGFVGSYAGPGGAIAGSSAAGMLMDRVIPEVD